MSQFGGSAQDDDYGFFGPSKASGSSFGGPPPTASQFGAPPPTQHDAPPASGPAPFGSPAPSGFGYATPAASGGPTAGTRSGKAKRGAMVTLTVVALAGGFFLWNAYQMNRPVTIPTTLGGMQQTTEQGLVTATAAAEAGIRSDNPGINMEAQAYGGKDGFILLFVTRGRVKVDQEFQDLGANSGRTTIGESQCATSVPDGLAFCLRTSRTKSVEVLLSNGSTLQQASAAVDTAWAAQ